MKKLLSLLLVMSVLVSVGGVLAATGNQTVEIIVGPDIVVAITPTLTFNGVVPSNGPTQGTDVTFNATDSNVDVTVTASVVAESILEGISLGVWGGAMQSIVGFSLSLPDANPVETLNSQIVVDKGVVPNTYQGVITYTVTGPTSS